MVPAKRTTVIRGELTITNHVCVCEHLHRHSNVATVRATHGECNLLLPELYDANVSAMAREGFTLSRIQLEDDVWYAQSWSCRPSD